MLEVFDIGWNANKNVRAITTTRIGGVSRGAYSELNLADHVNDKQDSVDQNRELLVTNLHLPASPKWLKQVHGVDIVKAENLSGPVEADGSYTTVSNCACAVLTADCLPVFISDTKGTAVGVFHAGWRGLADGILSNAVKAMRKHADYLIAAVGPAIGHNAFEVGKEVKQIFESKHGRVSEFFIPAQRPGHFYADLYGLAESQLYQLGIQSVWLPRSVCTYSDKFRFFSYRRDGQTGRMASLIWITKE